MDRTWCCLLAISLAAAGCAKSEDVAQNNPPPATGGKDAAASFPEAAAAPQAPVSTPTPEPRPDLKLNEAPGGRNSLGSERPGQPTAIEPAQPAVKEPQSSIPAEPARPKTVDEHLADFQTALRARNGDGAMAALRAAVKLDPNHRVAVANLSNLLQAQGIQLAQAGNNQQAHPKFLESASLMRGFRDAHQQLNAQERSLLSIALYNEACAIAVQGDANKALQSLRESFEAGFDDLAQVEKDTDLIEVRKLEGYQPLLEAQQAKVAEASQRALEAAREGARKLLAEHTSFPFDFELTDVDDKPLKLADSKGKVTIVDFWSTWRPQARASVAQWVQLQAKYKDEVRMIGLNYEREQGDAAKDVIRKFIADNGVNYPCALGDEALQSQVPQLNAFPTTLFLDRAGKVRLKVVGMQPRALLEAIVVELLAEDAPADAKNE